MLLFKFDSYEHLEPSNVITGIDVEGAIKELTQKEITALKDLLSSTPAEVLNNVASVYNKDAMNVKTLKVTSNLSVGTKVTAPTVDSSNVNTTNLKTSDITISNNPILTSSRTGSSYRRQLVTPEYLNAIYPDYENQFPFINNNATIYCTFFPKTHDKVEYISTVYGFVDLKNKKAILSFLIKITHKYDKVNFAIRYIKAGNYTFYTPYTLSTTTEPVSSGYAFHYRYEGMYDSNIHGKTYKWVDNVFDRDALSFTRMVSNSSSNDPENMYLLCTDQHFTTLSQMQNVTIVVKDLLFNIG